MANTVYDEHVKFYLSFVDSQLADPGSVLSILLGQVLDIVSGDLAGKRVCDLACGEGYLSRSLARLALAEVVGVDISSELIQIAMARTGDSRVSYRVDDVQQLT